MTERADEIRDAFFSNSLTGFGGTRRSAGAPEARQQVRQQLVKKRLMLGRGEVGVFEALVDQQHRVAVQGRPK